MAWVSLDDATVNLERDMRMFIDTNKTSPTPYVITSKSTVAYSYGNDMRVMRITFTEDEFNPETDNIGELLCDYIPPDKIKNPTSIEIFCNGNPEIRIGGRKNFRTEIPVEFSIIAADAWKDKIILTQTDACSCAASIAEDYAMVGVIFKLAAAADGQTGEIEIRVKGAV